MRTTAVVPLLFWLGPQAIAMAEGHRSPVDVAVVGRHLLTANHDSGTVSLLDAAGGAVLDEVAVGRAPSAVAARGGTEAVVTTGAGDLVILATAGGRLEETGRIRLGWEPAGVAVSADGSEAWVALSAVDRVAVVDLALPHAGAAARPILEITVGRLPRALALSHDGRTLAVTCSADPGIVLIDTSTRTVRSRHPFAGFNLGQPVFAADDCQIVFPWTFDGGSHPSKGNIRRGWVTGSRLGKLSLAADGEGLLSGLTLDVSGRAVGDVRGLAIAADGALVVAAGGTHELLWLRDGAAPLPFSQISGGEVMDRSLAGDSSRFRRLALGGRPLGIAWDASRGRAWVANRLLDALQEIDPAGPTLLRTLPLADPGAENRSTAASLARRGEAIFFDAGRSLDQWYSCHTCHYEGGGNTITFDTLNDGSAGTYKTVLPLWGVAETGPWTWHGWQRDFRGSLAKSLVDSMQGPPPAAEDVTALAAYLSTLAPPPSPHLEADGSLSQAAERGRRLFESDRTACTSCHAGPHLTTAENHDVGLVREEDRYDAFSPPTLRGIHRKNRLLHNGRASSIEEVLTRFHSPEKVSGLPPLSADEVADLAAYLRSL